MDIIKFTHEESSNGFIRHADVVQNIEKTMWVERFDAPSEFSLEAGISSRLKEQLPLGTLISHIGTGEVMMVEDHEISSQSEGEPIIKVTGRDLLGFLENRFPDEGYIPYDPLSETPALRYRIWPVSLALDAPQGHLGMLLLRNITPYMSYAEFNYSTAVYYAYSKSGFLDPEAGDWEAAERTIDRTKSVLTHVDELMKAWKMGVKVLRPGPFNPPPYIEDYDVEWNNNDLPSTPKILFEVHMGEDKRHVVFSYANGDIKNPDYLWSLRTLKNVAQVTSRWFGDVVGLPGDTEFNTRPGLERRTLAVDASEFDRHLETLPSGSTKTTILKQIRDLGRDRLKAQKMTAITRVEAVDNLSRWKYRRDYNLGDYVRIEGEYDETATAQVMEYVEIQDQEGERGYPTFRIDNEYEGYLPL